MKEPIWIELNDCLAFHRELLDRFGGLDGIRDQGMLESALNRPLQLFHYKQPDIFQLASAYAAGIVKNHPFLDGNKRSGLMAATLFLEVNRYCFSAPEEEAVVMTRALASGEIGELAYAAWLKDSSQKRTS